MGCVRFRSPGGKQKKRMGLPPHTPCLDTPPRPRQRYNARSLCNSHEKEGDNSVRNSQSIRAAWPETVVLAPLESASWPISQSGSNLSFYAIRSRRFAPRQAKGPCPASGPAANVIAIGVTSRLGSGSDRLSRRTYRRCNRCFKPIPVANKL